MALITVEFKVDAAEEAVNLAGIDKQCFLPKDTLSTDEWNRFLMMTHHCVVTLHDPMCGIVGAAVATSAAGIGYLYSNAVLRGHRRQGYGKELLNQRLNWLSRECSIVQAHTRVGNVPAHETLKSVGFAAKQYVPDFYGDFEDGILWEKVL